MITVKCPTCGVSYFQGDGNGQMICPHCKTKFSYEDSFGNFATEVGWIIYIIVAGIFVFLACVGAL